VAALSALFPHVAPLAPGAPEPVIDFAVRQAAIEWCRRTLCVQRLLDPMNTTANSAEVVFNVGPEEAVVKLLAARLAGQPLDLLRAEDLDDSLQHAPGIPRGVYCADGARSMYLHPAPSQAMPLQVRVALRPSTSATSLDDALADAYATELAHGAAALLCAQRERAYTNPQAAAGHRVTFEDAITKARVRAFQGNARSQPRVRPMLF
jgi:hypothetical protein